MLPDLSSVVRLQELDQRAAELTREVAALPKHIAEIERKLESHQRKLEADRAALAANQKDRKKLEGEIQIQQQKISKLKDQMREAKTNDQFRAFQHEIDFCETEIRKSEDKILDLMAESEPLEKNVKAAEVALQQEKAQVEAEKAEARRRTEADKQELEQVRVTREAVVAGLTPVVYVLYERIRKHRAGVAVAEVVAGRCSVCQIALRPQVFQEIKRAEKVVSCESCSRILIYHPPEPVETAGGEGTRVALS
ncbi:MAG: hypothetical protein HYR60_22175 [Acidobacteria bacterium]|nr:hypothetical protein [Acidobacteriota bacterium]